MMEFADEHEEEEEEDEEEEEEEEEGMAAAAANAAFKSDKNRAVRYRECLKNHAVGIGGHSVDGCGEFMPAGLEGTLDALKCAACNCHRNFHRKEFLSLDTSSSQQQQHQQQQQLTLFNPRHPPPHHHHHLPHHSPYNFYPYNRTTPYLHAPQPRPLALPSPAAPATDDGSAGGGMNMMTMTMMNTTTTSSSGKKRYRTKFTQEQKDKMLELAERLGWRIQKQDEGVVQQFCNETGVKRHVLKVWMHNNKHTLGKKP